MSIFEIAMLVCFGASWPFALAKTYKTKSVEGKSPLFLSLIFLGYLAGVMHKLFFNFDNVIYLYVVNGVMVFADLVLYCRYKFAAETVNAPQ